MFLPGMSAGAAPSLVAFRPGPALDGFERGFVRDRREIADPDSWGYLTAKVKGAIQALERAHGFRASLGYSRVMTGFAADLTEAQIQELRREPIVKSITIAVDMTSTQQRVPWGVGRVGAESWSVEFPGSRGGASRAPTAGKVTVYVIDSGIDASNPDLNVVKQVNFVGGPNTDCNGHGTHVAGTIGARDNQVGAVGMAPGVALVSVKVVDCSGRGSSATLMKGLDWVTARATTPAVVNLSLGGGESPITDAAVLVAAASGIFFSIAAGNDATDACLASPALNGATSGIVTVSAVDRNDLEADFSNFGGCVDLWAPGVGILSTAPTAKGEALAFSGTSMAAPHVAGAAALYLAENPKASPSEVESALIGSSMVPGTASKDGRTILRLRIAGY